MAKKFLLFTVMMFLLMAVITWSQPLTPFTQQTSLQWDFSRGVLWNELDQALNIGPWFSELANSYCFGGLGNMNKEDTLTTAGMPVWGGFYHAGAIPWSVFNGVEKLGLTPEIADDEAYTWLFEDVVVAPTTTRHWWAATQTTMAYTVPLFTQLTDAAQFLIGLGGLNTGLYLELDLNNTTDPLQNYTETFTDNYNTAGVGVVPVVLQDYTRTIVNKDLTDGAAGIGIDNTITAGIPVYIATGNLHHYVFVSAGYNWWDMSTNNTETYTVPQDPADTLGGTYTNIEENSVTFKGSLITPAIEYVLAMPGFLGRHPQNEFQVDITAGAQIDSMTLGTNYTDQVYTFAPAGAATATTRDYDTDDFTFGSTMGFNGAVAARHSFFFDLHPSIEFGMIPEFAVSYSSAPVGQNLQTWVQVNRVDVDNNGVFTSAADTIQTVTTTYYNSMMVAGAVVNASTDNNLTFTLTVPAALKFQIVPWLGVTLGASPKFEFQNTTTVTQGTETSVTTENALGDGTVVTTTVVNQQTSSSTTSYTRNFTVEVVHGMGVHFNLPADIVLYVDVAAAVVGVWDFRYLKVQAVIPLP